MDAKLNDNAAFEAHMMAARYLESGLGRTASAVEVACVLAKAYGDALAIAGAAANSDALVAGINTLAQDAYRETLEAVAGQACEVTS